MEDLIEAPPAAAPAKHAPASARRWPALRWWHAAAIFLATLLAIEWPLVTGHALEKWDALDFHLPFFVLVADFAQAHRFLHWNPWTNGGSPDFADPQVGAFSPLLLLFGALGGGRQEAFRMYWLTCWSLGGLGFLALARHLRAPVWAGLAVALGFGLSGYYTGHAEHLSVIYSYSFLPLVIWRLDVALQRGALTPALQAGALWGVSALGGNPLLTMLTACFAGIWALGRWWTANEPPVTLKRAIWSVAILGLVGAAVLSPAYYSFLHEGAGFSDRSGALPLEVTLENSLYPGAIASLASPYLAALRATVNLQLWSYTDLSSGGMYLGSVTLGLAFFALLARPRDKWRWLLFAVGLLALGCALGQALPLRAWLYTLFPPSRFFRHPSMFRGYFLFTLAVLALAGARDLQERLSGHERERLLQRFLAVAVVLALAGVVAFSVVLTAQREPGAAPGLATAQNYLAWLGLGAIAVAALAFRDKWAPARWLPIALALLALVDAYFAGRLSEPTLFDRTSPVSMEEIHHPGLSLGAAGFARYYATESNFNLLAKKPTFLGYSPFKNRYHEAIAHNRALAGSALGPERVWFAADAPIVPWSDDAFKAFATRFPTNPLIVRHARAELLGQAKPGALDAAAIERAPTAARQMPAVLEYEPDTLALRVDCPSDGWLLVTDRWSRSWTATVNGTAVPVDCANFIFRAVPVKRGENTIRFRFEPPAVWALLLVSWGTLGAVAVWSVVAAWRRARFPA